MSDRVWWIVFTHLAVAMVEAGSEQQARKEAIKFFHIENKPYLARDWKIRIATKEDRARWAPAMDAYRGSQPTARTAKKRGKTPSERLL
jgi:hypothetical protein